jgi:hypothetical protein
MWRGAAAEAPWAPCSPPALSAQKRCCQRLTGPDYGLFKPLAARSKGKLLVPKFLQAEGIGSGIRPSTSSSLCQDGYNQSPKRLHLCALALACTALIIQVFPHSWPAGARHREIARAFRLVRPLTSFAQAHTEFLDTFHAPDTGGEISAQETAIGGCVCQPPHRTEAQIDDSRYKLPGFQVHTIPEDNGLAERKSRL